MKPRTRPYLLLTNYESEDSRYQDVTDGRRLAWAAFAQTQDQQIIADKPGGVE